jgi:hypothetical protein
MDMMDNASALPTCHSDNINSRQLIKNGRKSPTRLHEEALIGSSWNRVGDFRRRRADKPARSLGILHFNRAWNLASMLDGTSIEAKPAALG